VATAGSLLLMAGGADAKPSRIAEVNAAREEQRMRQMAVIEYALKQQEIARQADLTAQ
jgi:hypothetical protein